MLCIGVTGLIGSGKSTVAALLSEGLCKCPVFDCDAEAKRILLSERDVVCGMLGISPAPADAGELKRLVSSAIFGDPKKRSVLEDFIWGSMRPGISALKSGPGDFFILDAPLLFQAGFDSFADRVVFVDAPETLRAERFVLRTGLSRRDFEGRNAVQARYFADNRVNVEPKISFRICNGGSIRELRAEVGGVAERLRAEILS